MAANFGDLAEQRFGEELAQAAGFKPITMQDLKDVYKRYEPVGVKVGQVKGKTDQQLYKKATSDVIKWWRHTKSEEEKAAAAAKKAAEMAKRQAEAAKRKAAEEAAAARRAQQEAARRAAAKKEADRRTAAARAAAQREARAAAAAKKKRVVASSAKAGAAVGVAAASAFRSTRVVQQTARTLLTNAGLSGVTPPSWAYKNETVLMNWIRKEVQRRQAIRARRRTSTVGGSARFR